MRKTRRLLERANGEVVCVGVLFLVCLEKKEKLVFDEILNVVECDAANTLEIVLI